ncbi:MAG TPA: MFS transporter [Burkholderiaceae bacterium]|nr:MFS transporter [Burkholderiaceae bacterium]
MGALRARTLPPQLAFLLLASLTLTFLAGSAAPTPLYALYRAQWHFSTTMLTAAFGVYAIAVLVSLLVVGRLSDHVGRRPVLLVATLSQLVAMGLFATASGLDDLLVARVVQGLSAGGALAAVGAGLLDLDRTRGATANAVAPMLGTAFGGLVAGAMVQYLPAPTHLVYAVLAVVFVVQASFVLFMAETSALLPGALASLRPQWHVPPRARRAVSFAAPTLIAVWSLAGFYGSLGPTLLRGLTGSSSVLLGGLALFLLAGAGAMTVLGTQRLGHHALTATGAVAIFVGLAMVLIALHGPSLILFMSGTTVAGMGFGAGFQGALRSVVTLIEAHERAGVVAVLFVISYLALGVPAIAAGYDVARRGQIIPTAVAYAAILMVLALFVLAASAWRLFRPDPTPR